MQYMNMNNAIREKGQLSVNGVGIVKVKSDLAILKVGVTTSNEDVQVAQVENTNTVNAVITSLTDYKIPRENKKSDYYILPVEETLNSEEGKKLDKETLNQLNKSLESTKSIVEK